LSKKRFVVTIATPRLQRRENMTIGAGQMKMASRQSCQFTIHEMASYSFTELLQSCSLSVREPRREVVCRIDLSGATRPSQMDLAAGYSMW
jgi:hypothetical protein